MKFNALMHVTFFTSRLQEMMDFYQNVLGGTLKIATKAKLYKGADGSHYGSVAEIDPERIIIVYIELAPGQFIELFPSEPGQKPHSEWNEEIGYSHFALTVDDIFTARSELEARGLEFDTEISKGPSETYQMWAHDPDGNRFEIMQFTDKSFQVIGNIME